MYFCDILIIVNNDINANYLICAGVTDQETF